MAGSPDNQIKSAGCWPGIGFRSYTDTQLTGDLEIPRLIARDSNSDSEDDPDSPDNLAMIDSMRKKIRPLPGGTVAR